MRSLIAAVALCLLLPPLALAQSYEDGLSAFEAGDLSKAQEIWSELARQGDPLAEYGLGKLYETGGPGVPADPGRAAGYYSKAADKDIAAAKNNLALMHSQGRGVKQDSERAAKLWHEAAQDGHIHAQYNLGLAYYRGEGVSRDEAVSGAWFLRAAEGGLAEAQFAVGEMHRLGVGLPKDEGVALTWFKRAREQGYVAASEQANRLIAQGVVPKDPATVASPVVLEPSKNLAEASKSPNDGQGQGQVAATVPVQAARTNAPEAPKAPEATEIEAKPEPEPEKEPATEPAKAETAKQPAKTASAEAAPVEPVQEAKIAAPEPGGPESESTPESEPASKTEPSSKTKPAPAAPKVEPAEVSRAPETAASNTAESDAGDRQTAAIARDTKNDGTATIAESEKTEGSASGGQRYGIWIGSMRSEDGAARLWDEEKAKHPDLLGPLDFGAQKVSVKDRGTFYRAVGGRFDTRTQAEAKCQEFMKAEPQGFCMTLPR